MRNKKKHIHVHENISTLLAPTMPLTGDFRALQSVFEAARNRYNNNSAACFFIDSLLQIVQAGIAYHAVNETTVFACPVLSRRNWPDGVWEELCREIMTGSIQDQIGNTLRFCQYVLRRRVRRVVVHCDRFRENMRRTISVHLKSEIPRRSAGTSYILYDASLSHDTAERLLGGPIVDITPPGKLQPLHRIVQYPDADIKIGTAPSRVQKILQSLLFLR